ncbi:MAG TPA: VWA domain-containing protein, partial [Candidatus Angelobacter sp.]|nr:VWA domain-containing protein [Candidatus Angelobacter sp.]
HLYFFYEVYDPAKDKSPEPTTDAKDAKEKTAPIKNPIHLLTSIVFFNGKVKAFETPLIEARQLNASDRKAAVFQFDVPLAQLKPGLYTCQINVIDDVGGNFLFPRLPILVREKTSTTPATVSSSSGGLH